MNSLIEILVQTFLAHILHVASIPSLQNLSNSNQARLYWIFVFDMQPANTFLFQKLMRMLHLLFLNKLTNRLKNCSFHSNVTAIDVGYVFDRIFIQLFFACVLRQQPETSRSVFGVLMQIRSCLNPASISPQPHTIQIHA